MLLNLQSEYAKATAPRTEPHGWARSRGRGEKAPPGPLRSGAARRLAGAARRLDRESARRALA